MTRHWFVWLVMACMALPSVVDAAVDAGAAKREITPSKPVPLAGYSKRRGARSTGVHDPLFARAVVLRDADTTAAIVSADLLIIDEVLAQAITERVRRVPGLQEATLLLAATHTHSGPGGYGRKFLEKISMGHYDQTVFNGLADAIAGAVQDAAQHLEPVTLHLGEASASDWIENRVQDAGPVDGDFPIIVLRGMSGQPIAAFVNFAAHPTTLGASNRQLSADYPGVLARIIEAQHRGIVALFLPGAVGDQGPVKRGEGFEAAEQMGQALGEKAARMVSMLKASPPAGALRAAQRVVPLPPARVRLGNTSMPRWLSSRLVDDDATLTVVAIDGITFVGAPCDLFSEFGQELKRHAQTAGRRAVITGFANDYIGYCIPESLYATDEYEAQMALNGPTTGTLLVSELKKMIDALAISDQPSAVSE